MPDQIVRRGTAINVGASRQPIFFFGLQVDLMGLSFHLSWLFLLLYAQPTAGCKSEVVEQIDGFSSLYLFSIMALIVTLLAFVIAGRHSEVALSNRAVTYAAMAFTFTGTAVYYLAALALPGILAFIAPLSGVLTGAGSAILAMRWAWGFEGISSSTIMCSAPSILAVTALFCVTIPHLPVPCTAFSVSILPLCSGFFALRLSQNNATAPQSALQNTEAPYTQPLQKSTSPEDRQGIVWKNAAEHSTHNASDSRMGTSRAASTGRIFYLFLCGGITLLGLTLGITRQSVVPLFSFDAVTIFLCSAAGAIFIGSALVIRHTSGASLNANLLAPAVVIGSFLVVLASTQPNRIAENFDALGHICLEMLFFAVLVITARRFSMRAVTVFATGRVTYALSNMIAIWLTKLYAAGATTNAIVQLTSFALLTGVEVIMVAAIVVVVLPRKGVGGNASAEAPSPAAGGMPATAEAFNANPGGSKKAPGAAAATAEPSGASETASKLPFQQRVSCFARTYQLTSREEEVAKLLLMGHSYSRIMQELCIAEGTVNCHARNIYAKAGIHSKQELMELFESDFSK